MRNGTASAFALAAIVAGGLVVDIAEAIATAYPCTPRNPANNTPAHQRAEATFKVQDAIRYAKRNGYSVTLTGVGVKTRVKATRARKSAA